MRSKPGQSIFKREATWMLWLSALPISLGLVVALIVWLVRFIIK